MENNTIETAKVYDLLESKSWEQLSENEKETVLKVSTQEEFEHLFTVVNKLRKSAKVSTGHVAPAFVAKQLFDSTSTTQFSISPYLQIAAAVAACLLIGFLLLGGNDDFEKQTFGVVIHDTINVAHDVTASILHDTSALVKAAIGLQDSRAGIIELAEYQQSNRFVSSRHNFEAIADATLQISKYSELANRYLYYNTLLLDDSLPRKFIGTEL